jgi:hypothetical protein
MGQVATRLERSPGPRRPWPLEISTGRQQDFGRYFGAFSPICEQPFNSVLLSRGTSGRKAFSVRLVADVGWTGDSRRRGGVSVRLDGGARLAMADTTSSEDWNGVLDA